MSHDVEKQTAKADAPSKRYEVPDEKRKQVLAAFTYHPPKDDQPPRYGEIRAEAREFALVLLRLTPPGREQSLALTSLEQAVMWANAAIARGE
jgi:hypothetical protein